MKLNFELVERALNQIDAEAISEDHPALPKLRDLFGDHTFFLDVTGLNIIEPMPERPQTGRMVNIASWDDDDPSQLAPHRPQPTDVVVEFAAMH